MDIHAGWSVMADCFHEVVNLARERMVRDFWGVGKDRREVCPPLKARVQDG